MKTIWVRLTGVFVSTAIFGYICLSAWYYVDCLVVYTDYMVMIYTANEEIVTLWPWCGTCCG